MARGSVTGVRAGGGSVGPGSVRLWLVQVMDSGALYIYIYSEKLIAILVTRTWYSSCLSLSIVYLPKLVAPALL
jgi:hypothetical protein